MSELVDRIKKEVGMDDSGYCMCCDVSCCCGALPEALDKIEKLDAALDAATTYIKALEERRGDAEDALHMWRKEAMAWRKELMELESEVRAYFSAQQTADGASYENHIRLVKLLNPKPLGGA